MNNLSSAQYAILAAAVGGRLYLLTDTDVEDDERDTFRERDNGVVFDTAAATSLLASEHLFLDADATVGTRRGFRAGRRVLPTPTGHELYKIASRPAEHAGTPGVRWPLGVDQYRQDPEAATNPYTPERPAVVGGAEKSAAGNSVIRVGEYTPDVPRDFTKGCWTQTMHLVLTPVERDELVATLIAHRSTDDPAAARRPSLDVTRRAERVRVKDCGQRIEVYDRDPGDPAATRLGVARRLENGDGRFTKGWTVSVGGVTEEGPHIDRWGAQAMLLRLARAMVTHGCACCRQRDVDLAPDGKCARCSLGSVVVEHTR